MSIRLLLNLRRCLHRARTVGHTLIYIWGVFRCVTLYMWAGYGWLQSQYLESNLSPDHPPDSLERRSGIFVKCTSALDRVLNSRHLRDTSNVLPTTPTRRSSNFLHILGSQFGFHRVHMPCFSCSFLLLVLLLSR